MTTIKNLIFDLDRTLYPLECNIFSAFMNKVENYFRAEKGFKDEDISQLVDNLATKYHNHDWAQLMKDYKINPPEFLEYVCNIDIGFLEPNLQLAEVLSKLPYRKFIFSDSSHRHISDSLQRLKIDADLFEGVAACSDIDYLFKVNPSSFGIFLNSFGLKAEECIMFEDSKSNLKSAKSLGMTTVLITKEFINGDYIDHQFPDINTALETLF